MGAPSSASTTRNGLIESSRSRSEEHTSELQSPCNLVCRLLLEKKKYDTPVQAKGADSFLKRPLQARTSAVADQSLHFGALYLRAAAHVRQHMRESLSTVYPTLH